MASDASEFGTRKTVDKAMQILHAFSHEEPQLTVGELSRRLGMHKSVVSRLVASLREWRMLDQDPVTKGLRIGVGAFQVGMLFAQRQELHRLALPFLGALVERTHQSSHVSILDGDTTLVVATVESPNALRVIMRQGERRHLHATAAGKLMLAFSSPDLLGRLLRDKGLPALTPATITDPDLLLEALAAARRDGLAWNEGESAIGAGAVAAPIFGADGIAGALSTVYPLAVVDPEERLRIAQEVKQIAEQLSTALGSKRVRGRSQEKGSSIPPPRIRRSER